jgi:hypothetical protein
LSPFAIQVTGENISPKKRATVRETDAFLSPFIPQIKQFRPENQEIGHASFRSPDSMTPAAERMTEKRREFVQKKILRELMTLFEAESDSVIHPHSVTFFSKKISSFWLMTFESN